MAPLMAQFTSLRDRHEAIELLEPADDNDQFGILILTALDHEKGLAVQTVRNIVVAG